MQKMSLIGILIFLNSIPLVSATPPHPRCKVIARVIESSDPRYKPGHGICEGQQNEFSGTVTIACTGTLKPGFEARSASEASRCLASSQTSRRGRGENVTKPTLLRPAGASLSQRPVNLNWLPVVGADAYKVSLIGVKNFIQWKKVVTQTNLLIPSLTLEKTTQVLIEALNSRGKVISYSTTTFNFLDQTRLNNLSANLQVIDGFSVSDNEKNYLKISLFEKFGLIENAISYVENKINQNPLNTELFKILKELNYQAGIEENISEFNSKNPIAN